MCRHSIFLEYTSPTGCVKPDQQVIVREPDELYISVDNYLNYSQSGTINISVNGGVGNVINQELVMLKILLITIINGLMKLDL